MNWPTSLVAIATLLVFFLSSTLSAERDSPSVYTNTYAVHISGGPERAHQLAKRHGFINLGHVRWVEQQTIKKRAKRDRGYMPPIDPDQSLGPRIQGKDYNPRLNDALWPKLWYLKRGGGLNMNVLPAWQKGYSGKGVVVSILDDGIEKNHPDLMNNYDAAASYDVNSHDDDPQPRYDFSNENRHGTRCAGEVAAEANNTICSVGVAFRAGIGGVRMLDGDVTDAVESRSLSHNPSHVDIYSASWGPDDDGKTVDGPGRLAKESFSNGIKKGRGGKGSIFVWASGNGGRSGDSCGCDGYTNSIFTISVSSATERGEVPWYSERCASTIATTYSSGDSGEKQVVTTDLRKSCTEKHSGTSASAPLAAGICALALEANPNLTWRDLQHIIVRTAKTEHLKVNDWMQNGAGYRVSHSFGFGLMDAAAMVDLARQWQSVPEQHICTASGVSSPMEIPQKGFLEAQIQSNGCKDNKQKNIQSIEHVIAKVTISYSRRGDLEIHLVSPSGTDALLLPRRGRDYSNKGFSDWEFLSTHSWGESPMGTWTLRINNTAPQTKNTGKLIKWDLILYGTGVHPIQKHSGPDSCEQGQYMESVYDDNSSAVVNDCLPCHASCLNCYGGEPHQCIDCQFNFHKRDTYCIVNTSLLTASPAVVGFIAALVGTLLVLVVIILALVVHRSRAGREFSSTEYSKLLEEEEECSDGEDAYSDVKTAYRDDPIEDPPSPPPPVVTTAPDGGAGIPPSDQPANGDIPTA